MLSLGSFRGGPVFPAMFLAAAGGIVASRLHGFSLTPAVAVAIGTEIAAVLRLPLAAIVLATLLTAYSGDGDEPLIIIGVVVSYLVTLLTSAPAAAAARAGDGTVAAQTATPEVPAGAPGGARRRPLSRKNQRSPPGQPSRARHEAQRRRHAWSRQMKRGTSRTA